MAAKDVAGFIHLATRVPKKEFFQAKMVKNEGFPMKKALAILAGAMLVPLFCSQAWADDDSAKSVNAVGVIKYTIPANGVITCVSLPLNPIGEAEAWYWPDTDIAKKLPGGSTVYFWNPQNAGWEYSTKTSREKTWPNVLTTNLMMVEPGQAFFLRGPASIKTNIVVSLLGELPTDDSLTFDVTGANNLDMRGISMYPVEMVFTNSAFAQNLPGGSMVYFWTGTQWAYSTKSSREGTWSSVPGKDTLFVGEGVFVKKPGAGMEVEEPRPFNWD